MQDPDPPTVEVCGRACFIYVRCLFCVNETMIRLYGFHVSRLFELTDSGSELRSAPPYYLQNMSCTWSPFFPRQAPHIPFRSSLFWCVETELDLLSESRLYAQLLWFAWDFHVNLEISPKTYPKRYGCIWSHIRYTYLGGCISLNFLVRVHGASTAFVVGCQVSLAIEPWRQTHQHSIEWSIDSELFLPW